MIYKGNIDSWNEWLELKEKGYTAVDGNFHCAQTQLTSLVGSPITVTGYFYCQDNKLTSLEGEPHTVSGLYYVKYNPIDKNKIVFEL